MTKEDLILKLEQEIVVINNYDWDNLDSNSKLTLNSRVTTIYFILEDIKNINVETVKLVKACDCSQSYPIYKDGKCLLLCIKCGKEN